MRSAPGCSQHRRQRLQDLHPALAGRGPLAHRRRRGTTRAAPGAPRARSRERRLPPRPQGRRRGRQAGRRKGSSGLGRACEAKRFWHTRMPVYGPFDARFSPYRAAFSHVAARRRCRRRASAASRRCACRASAPTSGAAACPRPGRSATAARRDARARRRNMRASGLGRGMPNIVMSSIVITPSKRRVEAERVEHPHRVGARRVGQDVLAPRQAARAPRGRARCRAAAPRARACDASLPGSARRGCRGGAPGRAASRRSAASSAGAARRPPRASMPRWRTM